MKTLLLILSIMTFTVQSKTAVEATGEFPYDIEIGYASTYTKSQVRAGDESVLTLANLGGITVQSITAIMHANSSSGAGNMTVQAGDQTLVNRKISYKEVGENWKEITLFDGQQHTVHDLTIRLTGSENSLFINSYSITYYPRAPYTVTLMNGAEIFSVMTESRGIAGIILPSVPNTDMWRFIGWTKTPTFSTTESPQLISAGAKYYPDSDETLWAAFIYNQTPETVYATELQDGVYQYVNRQSGNALTGVPYSDGTMDFAVINPNDANQRYEITFTAEGKAYITHAATGTPIGYASGAKIVPKASLWSVYHDGDQILFYATISGKNYVLWLNIQDKVDNDFYYAGLLNANPGPSFMALQISAQATEYVYTCHPETPMEIETVNADRIREERVIRFGIYELKMKDGKKELRIR